MCFLFLQFTLSSANSDTENVRFGVSNGVDFGFPMVLMLVSLIGLCFFYFMNMKRIMKEITNVSPIFEVVENETKMEFTIAERQTSQ